MAHYSGMYLHYEGSDTQCSGVQLQRELTFANNLERLRYYGLSGLYYFYNTNQVYTKSEVDLLLINKGSGTLNYFPLWTSSGTLTGTSNLLQHAAGYTINDRSTSDSIVRITADSGLYESILQLYDRATLKGWSFVYGSGTLGNLELHWDGAENSGTYTYLTFDKTTPRTVLGQNIATSGKYISWAGTSNGVYIDSNNWVGINIAPTSPLHVNGDLTLQGYTKSILGNYPTAGCVNREMLYIRAKETNSSGAGIDLYGNSDPVEPGAAILYTNATGRLKINKSGYVYLDVVPNATVDTDKFMVLESGIVKYRTGVEALSDMGGVFGSGTNNYLPVFSGSDTIVDSPLYVDVADVHATQKFFSHDVLNGLSGLYVSGVSNLVGNLNVSGNTVISQELRVGSGAYIGDGGVANYVKINQSGHLSMSGYARPWRDELIPVLSFQKQGAEITIDSSECVVVFQNNTKIDDFMYTNVQLNHDKDLSTPIYPHLHYWQSEANVPHWVIQYRWQVNGAAKNTTWTTRRWSSLVYTYTAGTLNQIVNFSGIVPPSGTGVSDIIQFRIIRDNENQSTLFTGNDPVAGSVYLMAADFHIQLNSIGSDEQWIKEL